MVIHPARDQKQQNNDLLEFAGTARPKKCVAKLREIEDEDMLTN